RMRLRFGAGPQFSNGKAFFAALAEMTYNHSRFTSYALTYNAGLGTSGGLASTTYNQALFATISHVKNRLQSEFRVGYSRASEANINTVLSPLVTSGFTNNELIIDSQIAYTIGEKVGIFFDYSHSRQFGGVGSSI